MAQRFAATTDLRDHADDILDAWLDSIVDGEIDDREILHLTELLETLVAKVTYVDDTLVTGLSWLKNGLDAEITKRRLRDHQRVHGVTCIDEYRRIRKRPDHGNDPSAA